ncbi:unnamed protein product [Camellia sinensis]
MGLDLNLRNSINERVLIRSTEPHGLAPIVEFGELDGLDRGFFVDTKGGYTAPVGHLDEIVKHDHHVLPETCVTHKAVSDYVFHCRLDEEAPGSCPGWPAVNDSVYQALELWQELQQSTHFFHFACGKFRVYIKSE